MNRALVGLVLAAMPSIVSAATIDQFTSGTQLVTLFVGEVFTTPSGGPWTNITFNFYSDAPPMTPAASGTGFLLTQEYLGTPEDLSGATPGFLASATASGGIYDFGAVVLQPDTEYWVYDDAPLTNSGSGSAGTAGQHVYFATSDATDFTPAADQTANFNVSGDIAGTPEPGTMSMFLGCGALVLFAFRRRMHTR